MGAFGVLSLLTAGGGGSFICTYNHLRLSYFASYIRIYLRQNTVPPLGLHMPTARSLSKDSQDNIDGRNLEVYNSCDCFQVDLSIYFCVVIMCDPE